MYHLKDKKLYPKIKGFRFSLILIIRLFLQEKNQPLPPMNSRKMEKLCTNILDAIEDVGKFESIMQKAVDKLLDCAIRVADNEGNIDQAKLTTEILKKT